MSNFYRYTDSDKLFYTQPLLYDEPSQFYVAVAANSNYGPATYKSLRNELMAMNLQSLTIRPSTHFPLFYMDEPVSRPQLLTLTQMEDVGIWFSRLQYSRTEESLTAVMNMDNKQLRRIADKIKMRPSKLASQMRIRLASGRYFGQETDQAISKKLNHWNIKTSGTGEVQLRTSLDGRKLRYVDSANNIETYLHSVGTLAIFARPDIKQKISSLLQSDEMMMKVSQIILSRSMIQTEFETSIESAREAAAQDDDDEQMVTANDIILPAEVENKILEETVENYRELRNESVALPSSSSFIQNLKTDRMSTMVTDPNARNATNTETFENIPEDDENDEKFNTAVASGEMTLPLQQTPLPPRTNRKHVAIFNRSLKHQDIFKKLESMLDERDKEIENETLKLMNNMSLDEKEDDNEVTKIPQLLMNEQTKSWAYQHPQTQEILKPSDEMILPFLKEQLLTIPPWVSLETPIPELNKTLGQIVHGDNYKNLQFTGAKQKEGSLLNFSKFNLQPKTEGETNANKSDVGVAAKSGPQLDDSSQPSAETTPVQTVGVKTLKNLTGAQLSPFKNKTRPNGSKDQNQQKPPSPAEK